MRSAYVYDPKEVDEAAILGEASFRFANTKEQTMIHFHKYRESCNDKCYISPSQEKDDADSK